MTTFFSGAAGVDYRFVETGLVGIGASIAAPLSNDDLFAFSLDIGVFLAYGINSALRQRYGWNP